MNGIINASKFKHDYLLAQPVPFVVATAFSIVAIQYALSRDWQSILNPGVFWFGLALLILQSLLAQLWGVWTACRGRKVGSGVYEVKDGAKNELILALNHPVQSAQLFIYFPLGKGAFEGGIQVFDRRKGVLEGNTKLLRTLRLASNAHRFTGSWAKLLFSEPEAVVHPRATGSNKRPVSIRLLGNDGNIDEIVVRLEVRYALRTLAVTRAAQDRFPIYVEVRARNRAISQANKARSA